MSFRVYFDVLKLGNVGKNTKFFYRKKSSTPHHVILPRVKPKPEPKSARLSTDLQPLQQISIPKKKKRDELSLLKALASTVKKDYHGPEYKYIDDPYLIPHGSQDKKAFSLATASGKKAARYVLEINSKNFIYNPTEPKLEIFDYQLPTVFEPNTIEGLQERVDKRMISEAFETYQSLKNENQEIPEDLVKKLLALLCFYNSSDRPEQLLPEEVWFKHEFGLERSKRVQNKWKSGAGADEIFNSIENKCPEVYNIMIQGLIKNFASDKAFDLYTEMKSKGMNVPLKVYNGMLSIVSFLRDRVNLKWQLLREIFNDMKKNNVDPDLTTFNSALFSITRMSKSPLAFDYMNQIINEMKEVNIEPNLSTWYNVLQISYGRPDAQNNILGEVMDKLEGQIFQLSNETDCNIFFITPE
ncbi:DgyrCDS10845 [Dimorphilus gyrociliatus]|uniref:Small ribosomal subunit protein mS39 n=1 Tax=Dimorphilus gyrociliatus TaxID=2664684 RepID=A0A7I8W420_9ANNE|nr:DgyrCDS10845 [Dimorphilus gyrociliatus]